MFQIKKNKNIAMKLYEMKITNMYDKQLKVMILNILTGLQKRVEDLYETFSKEIDII